MSMPFHPADPTVQVHGLGFPDFIQIVQSVPKYAHTFNIVLSAEQARTLSADLLVAADLLDADSGENERSQDLDG